MNTKVRVLFFGIVGLVAVALFGNYFARNVFFSQGAEEKVNIEITSGKNDLSEPVNFIFKPEKTDGKISALDLSVTTEGGTIDGWYKCTTIDGDGQIFTEIVDSANGTQGRYSCGVFKSDKELPSAVIISADMKCGSSGKMMVKIDTQKTQVIGPVQNELYALAGATSAEFNCDGSTSGGAGGGGAGGGGDTEKSRADIVTSFSPETCTTAVGGNCKYDLKINSQNNNKISAVFAHLAFDRNYVKLTRIDGRTPEQLAPDASGDVIKTDVATPLSAVFNSFKAVYGLLAQATTVNTPTPAPLTNVGASPTPASSTPKVLNPTFQVTPVSPSGTIPTVDVPTGSPQPSVQPLPKPGTCEVASAKVDNDKGEILMVYLCNTSESQLGTQLSIPIEFQGIKDGYGSVTIEKMTVVGPGNTEGYSVHRGKAEYIIGKGDPRGKGKVELDMKFKLQCVINKPKHTRETARIGIAAGGLKDPVFKTVEFNADNNGVWSGKAEFDVAPGNGYFIYSKFGKHVQKKIGSNSPKEDYPGAYKGIRPEVSLQEKTTIDMSNIILLTGDLAHDTQDGIVNSYDMAKIRLCLGKKDQSCIDSADLDYNNVVNASDWACAISALSFRWDEE